MKKIMLFLLTLFFVCSCRIGTSTGISSYPDEHAALQNDNESSEYDDIINNDEKADKTFDEIADEVIDETVDEEIDETTDSEIDEDAPSSDADVDPALPSCNENSYEIGSFCIEWIEDNSPKQIVIYHKKNLERAIFETIPGENFISANYVESHMKVVRGSFTAKDNYEQKCTDQHIEKVEKTGETLEITGNFGDECTINFTLQFLEKEENHLGFDIQIDPLETTDTENRYWRAVFRYKSYESEGFYGFGEQYTHLDQKGRRLPIVSQEQGHGRGLEPITTVLNRLGEGAAGSWHTTYTAVPQYISTFNRSLFLENYEYTIFDFENADIVEIEVDSHNMTGRILYGETFLDLITQYTKYSGRMKSLPQWMGEGAVLGIKSGEQNVTERYHAIKDAGTPISTVWIEDWVGERKALNNHRMWWNWELDRDRYPNWEDLIEQYNQDGARVMTYINPFVTDASSKENVVINLFDVAKEKGYLLKDTEGNPKPIGSGGFDAYLIDFSNPDAKKWYKSIIQENIIDTGIRGWMADFGEALPYDSVPFSGESPRSYHNKYVYEWNMLNKEIIAENNLQDEAVVFMRAGVAKSPGLCQLFWVGDQLATWDEYDGLKSVLNALISAGFSGYSINHADIGGIIEMNYLVFKAKRTKELMQRNMELAAFTPIYRSHQGNTDDSGGYYVSKDEEILNSFAFFAKVFKALNPYRMEVMKQAQQKGYPVMRHLMLHYPDDLEVYNIQYQYMLGSEFLIAPVLDKETIKTDIYLPKGEWVYIWDQREYGSTTEGVWLQDFYAPIGKPPVFYKKGSTHGETFIKTLKEEGLIQ